MWVTSDRTQPERIGGRVLALPLGTVTVVGTAAPLPAPTTRHVPHSSLDDHHVVYRYVVVLCICVWVLGWWGLDNHVLSSTAHTLSPLISPHSPTEALSPRTAFSDAFSQSDTESTRYNTGTYNTGYNTVTYNTVTYNTATYNTVTYNTVTYNTGTGVTRTNSDVRSLVDVSNTLEVSSSTPPLPLPEAVRRAFPHTRVPSQQG